MGSDVKMDVKLTVETRMRDERRIFEASNSPSESAWK
jgi:hypothetical protein